MFPRHICPARLYLRSVVRPDLPRWQVSQTSRSLRSGDLSARGQKYASVSRKLPCSASEVVIVLVYFALDERYYNGLDRDPSYVQYALLTIHLGEANGPMDFITFGVYHVDHFALLCLLLPRKVEPRQAYCACYYLWMSSRVLGQHFR